MVWLNMARLPTADDLPQSVAQTAMKSASYTARPMTGIASGLDKAGAELMAKAEQDRKTAESYEADKARVDYLRKESELRMKYETDPDYKTAPDRMKAELEQFRTARMSGLPANAAKDFDLWGQQQVVQAYERQDGDRKLKYKAEELGTWKQNTDDLEALAARQKLAGDIAGFAQTMDLINSSDDKIAALAPEARMSIAEARAGGRAVKMGKIMADNLPANKVAAWLKKPDPSIPPQPRPSVSNEAIYAAFHAQESSSGANARTSIDGAVGDMQILPETFKRFALKGEDINNPEDNKRVGRRMLDKFMKDYNGDPARVAVAYFSGEGNVAPEGFPTPYLRNSKDGNGKYTADYANDIVKRVGGTVANNQPTTGFYEIDRWRDSDPIGFKNFVTSKSAFYRQELQDMVQDDIAKVGTGVESVELPKDAFEIAFPDAPEKAYEEYKDQRSYAQTMSGMKDAPPEIQQANLQILEPNANSPNYARELKQYEDAKQGVAQLRNAFMADPVTYAKQSGIAPDVQPLDFSSDGRKLVGQLQQRSQLAAKLSGTYKVPNRLFTDAEVANLEAVYTKGKTEDVSKLLSVFGEGLSVDQRRGLAQELHDKKATSLAIAMAQPLPIAYGIIEGQRSGIELDKETSSAIENTLLGTTYDAEMFDGQKDAVAAYYKKLLIDRGGDKSYNEDLLNTAFEKVIGPVVEIDPSISGGNSKVFSFRRADGNWASAGNVEDIFSNLTNDKLLKTVGSLPRTEFDDNVDISDVLSEGRIYSAGDGKYGFKMVINGLAVPVVKKDGSPYIVDAKVLDAMKEDVVVDKSRAVSPAKEYKSMGGFEKQMNIRFRDK